MFQQIYPSYMLYVLQFNIHLFSLLIDIGSCLSVIMDVEGYFPHYPYNRNCTVDLVCHYMCSCAGVNYINICKVIS